MEGLEIQDIWKRFGEVDVLRGVSFKQEKGEILALLGPSGSGKTTLLEIIAGLADPDQGDCLWNGESLLEVPPHLRNFGLMFQEYVLFPHKNVGENVAFGLKMAGTNREITSTRVNEVLDLVGLSGLENRDPATLSGGEQQRIALARSLAPEPRLVMLDEPLGALDRSIRERLIGELRDILKSSSQTALYVTHDQEEAFRIADRVVILGNGKTAQIGTPRQIYHQPNSPYIARFLGMNNLLKGEAKPSAKGTVLETDIGTWLVEDPHQGSGVILIRPDQIRVGPEDDKRTSSLTGILVRSSFSGSAIHLNIEINSQQLGFSCSDCGMDIPQTGEPIQISFDPNKALLFIPA